MFFFSFQILPFKVHADVVIYLQYHGGKIATMSEMFLKMGLKFGYQRNTSTNTGYQENWTVNGPAMVTFHDSLTNINMIFFVLSWTWCMAGEQWISGVVWHRNIMVTKYQPTEISWLLNISPEVWVVSSPGTTWYPWIHIVLYRNKHRNRL